MVKKTEFTKTVRLYTDADVKEILGRQPIDAAQYESMKATLEGCFVDIESGASYMPVPGTEYCEQIPEVPAMNDDIRKMLSLDTETITIHQYSLDQCKQIVEAYFGAKFGDFVKAEIYSTKSTASVGNYQNVPGILEVALYFKPGLVNTAYNAPYRALKENPKAKEVGNFKQFLNKGMSIYDRMSAGRDYTQRVNNSVGEPPYLPTPALLGALPGLIKNQALFTPEELVKKAQMHDMLPASVLSKICNVSVSTTGSYVVGAANRDAVNTQYVYTIFGIDLGTILACTKHGNKGPGYNNEHVFIPIKGNRIGGTEMVTVYEAHIKNVQQVYAAGTGAANEAYSMNETIIGSGWNANNLY